MSHTDLHAKTEAKAYSSSGAKAAKTYPKDVAKPTTPDEKQTTENDIKYRTVWKGSLTRSEIYERAFPDGTTTALRIDGPADNGGFMTFKSDGSLVLRTGKKSKEVGASSGSLNIHTNGQQQKHEGKTYIQYNRGSEDTKDKEALNIIAYGDIVEDAVGSERHIKAKKIMITAEEELILVAGTQVFIQAGKGPIVAGGTVTTNAGTIETYADNIKEGVTGQRLTVGAPEETKVAYDPRSNQSIVSPGHINWKILGDYSQWVGGISEYIVAGGTPAPPLIENRVNAYTVKTAIGGQAFESVDYINRYATGGISDSAGGSIDILAGGEATFTATDTQFSTANFELDAAAVDILGSGDVSITSSGTVRITGTLIYLN